MAMLAEVKRKASWVLNPRSSDWSKDQNKLGQKMLEKMGWSVGKGLGAKEQGPVEAIRVAHKANVRGLGAGRKKEQEYWLNQQENFQSLLEQLNGGTNQTVEVKSLEHKSKTSKTRVHYHKFTRGKDISRYSQKDLSCIVGAAPSSKVLSVNTIQQDSVQRLTKEKEDATSEDENLVNMKLRSQVAGHTGEELSTSDLPSSKPKKTKKPTELSVYVKVDTTVVEKKTKKAKIKNSEQVNELSTEPAKKRSQKKQQEISDDITDQKSEDPAENQKKITKTKKKTKKATDRMDIEVENQTQKAPLTESVSDESVIGEKKRKNKKAVNEKKKEAHSQKPSLLEINDSCSDVVKQDHEDETDLGSINSQSSLFNETVNSKALKSPQKIAVPTSVFKRHILSPDSEEDVKSVEEQLTGVPKAKKKKKAVK